MSDANMVMVPRNNDLLVRSASEGMNNMYIVRRDSMGREITIASWLAVHSR
jgi:hypothetical protein